MLKKTNIIILTYINSTSTIEPIIGEPWPNHQPISRQQLLGPERTKPSEGVTEKILPYFEPICVQGTGSGQDAGDRYPLVNIPKTMEHHHL